MYQSVIPSWHIKPRNHWTASKQCAEIDRRVVPKSNATALIRVVRHHLTTEDIKRLQPLRWLNDDLITFGLRYVLTSVLWMEALVLMHYALEAWYSIILPFHITFLLLARIFWRKCEPSTMQLLWTLNPWLGLCQTQGRTGRCQEMACTN